MRSYLLGVNGVKADEKGSKDAVKHARDGERSQGVLLVHAHEEAKDDDGAGQAGAEGCLLTQEEVGGKHVEHGRQRSEKSIIY